MCVLIAAADRGDSLVHLSQLQALREHRHELLPGTTSIMVSIQKNRDASAVVSAVFN